MATERAQVNENGKKADDVEELEQEQENEEAADEQENDLVTV